MKGAKFRIVMVLTVLILLCVSVDGAIAAAHVSGDGSAVVSGLPDGVVSIPLLPHSVVKERRLAERNGVPFPRVERPAHSKYHIDDDDSSGRNLLSDPEAAVAVQVAGLFQGYGTHYADLWCGTPPQRQTVIVDTGSGVTAFPCMECQNCGVPDYHIDPLFDESLSKTFKKLSCEDCLRGSCASNECSIGMSYQEGSSWSAFEAADQCYVGGFHDRPVNKDDGSKPDDLDPFHAPNFAFDMKFGCQTRITGLFISQLADGIMGMDVASAAFWWQMYDAGLITKKAFSLCFSRQAEAARTGTEAGAMSLGGTDSRLHLSPMVYSATQESSGFYVVHVRKLYLRAGGGGLSAKSTDPKIKIVKLDISEENLNSGRVIVDSGTTDTYFSRRLSSEFGRVYYELTGETYGHGARHFTPEELAQEPTILFQLSGNTELNQAVLDRNGKDGNVVGLAGDIDPENPLDVILAIPPEHYYEYDPDEKGYVSRFYVDESGGGVLGANAMMGHDVYFDVDQFRVGWAESSCDYTALVSAYTKDWVPPKEDLDPSRIEPAAESKSAKDNGDPFSGKGDDKSNQFDDGQDGEPSGTYNFDAENGGICTGLICQASILASLVVVIVYVAQRMIRRSPSGPAYDLAGSELELRAVDEDVEFDARREGALS